MQYVPQRVQNKGKACEEHDEWHDASIEQHLRAQNIGQLQKQHKRARTLGGDKRTAATCTRKVKCTRLMPANYDLHLFEESIANRAGNSPMGEAK